MSKSNHTVTLPREELEELERKASEGCPVETIQEHELDSTVFTKFVLDIRASQFDKQYEAVIVNGKSYYRHKNKTPFEI